MTGNDLKKLSREGLQKICLQKWLMVVLYAGWVLFIWNNSMQSGIQSGSASGQLTEMINEILADGDTIVVTEHFIRKAAHFAEYAVLGVLTVLMLQQGKKLNVKYSARMLTIGCVTAVLDETIQYFTPGRFCAVTDMMIDMGGVLCGFTIFAGLWVTDQTMRKRILKVLLLGVFCAVMILIAYIA